MTTYKVVRVFFNSKDEKEIIKSGISLEKAQEHCNSSESSSSSAKSQEAIERTEKYGPWFDCYYGEN